MTIFGLQIQLKPGPAGISQARAHKQNTTSAPGTLAALAPGCQARVTGFGPRLTPEQRAHLQAYGVIPGHSLSVIQHLPVTVALIEHTELALESGVAAQIYTEMIEG